MPGHLLADEKAAGHTAVAEGVLVALILGSTLVLVKVTLAHLGPLTIAALRYLFAFLLLLPFVFHRHGVVRFSAGLWVRFLLLGVSFYVVGNGALFWGLKYIPATTGSLLLSLVPLLVLVAGVAWLGEVPARGQVVGTIVSLSGSLLFFWPGLGAGELLGIGIVAVGLVGNAAFGLLGREVAREERVDTLTLTAVPLGLGSVLLLPVALALEGWPSFSPEGWGLVLALAVVNTAVVYGLYNHALRTLAAFELSLLINLTPLVTLFWAWLLLDEQVSTIQGVGMAVVIVGVILVQRESRVGVPPSSGEAGDTVAAHASQNRL